MPTIIKVSLSELPTKLRERAKKRKQAVIDALRAGAHTHTQVAIQRAIDSTQPRPPVDRAIYRRSWQTKNTEGGATIFSTSPYASIIEHGRRPGAKMPPLKAIAGWVARKGLVPGKTQADREGAAMGVAFAIARKIAKQGLPAKRVLARAQVQFMPLILADVRAAIAKV